MGLFDVKNCVTIINIQRKKKKFCELHALLLLTSNDLKT